jgi:hypothetical protein
MSADPAPAEPDESKGKKEAENLWRTIYNAEIRDDIVGTDAVASRPTFKRESARHAEALNVASSFRSSAYLVGAPPALTYCLSAPIPSET